MQKREEIKTFVIVNPNSAGGATMKRWPRTSEKLARQIGKFEYEFTNAAGVATMLAEKAVQNGFEKIIAVGGDGTLHEIIQGIMKDGQLTNPDLLLGLLPSGTGTDFARTLKIPTEPEEAIVKLRGRGTQKIDIGLAHFKDHQGNKTEQYFINMADVGLGGEVAERTNNSPKVFGGFATYLFSSVISFAKYKPKRVKIWADDVTLEESVTSVFVANGRYYGGGMHIAPDARPDDGQFDVVIVKELSKWDVVSFTPKLYSGKLMQDPNVRFIRAKTVEVESDEEVLISLDGEQPGVVPVQFETLPRAINFLV